MLNNADPTTVQYAFFDVDDTIISDKSMFSFMTHYFKYLPNCNLQRDFNETLENLIKKDTDWGLANQIYYSYFKHFSIAEVELVAKQWFLKYSADKTVFYHRNIIQVLRQHQEESIECVFVSGSFRELLQPIADDLGVKHILSINLEREGERYTGNIIPPQTIGEGKADAIHLFLAMHGGDARECYAYGDDISDVPMLKSVGNPRAVAGGRRLETYAKDKGWPILQPN
jgi:HAD superfamily hydrolase (TIGR01490 family)